MDINRGNVKVAGALISSSSAEFEVAECYITEMDGTRKLVAELKASNDGEADVEMHPSKFHLVLVDSADVYIASKQMQVFQPMYHRSSCEEAPASYSKIPSGSTRIITLHFWGENLPRGDEWDNYYLTLEYYDAVIPLLLSKHINPEER
ncbi:MAG: hypothetical protein SWK76_17370 [Actinomycetota bacterium]|nr:hypothetical protein [Actinomycetota bacterium]